MRQPLVITLAELRALIDDADAVWIVYAPDSVAFAAGHIPGSLALPAPAVLAALAAQAPAVLYGEGPEAATAAGLAASLRHLGVRWYRDGLAGWVDAGGTVDTATEGTGL